MLRHGLVPLAVVFGLLAVASAQPTVKDARMDTHASSGLEKEVQALTASRRGPEWLGYTVPLAPGASFICCLGSGSSFAKSMGCCSGCRLEGKNEVYTSSDRHPCQQRSSGQLNVLFRIEGERIRKVRVFTADCALAGGGLPLHWLTGVPPAESLRFLASLVGSASAGKSGEDFADDALWAIAAHDEPQADVILERFAAPGQPYQLREKASFWIGQQRGRHGFEFVRDLLRREQDSRMREHLTFVLSETNEAEAIPELIRVARTDPIAKVRGEALHWMAQKAGKKVAGEVVEAIERDPETEVKKKAVFALSEMPDNEGVPLLIQLARTHKNPEVRKEAILWLGESDDPRALAFLEDVLLH